MRPALSCSQLAVSASQRLCRSFTQSVCWSHETEGVRFDFGYPSHSPSHSLFETGKIGSINAGTGSREFYLQCNLSNWWKFSRSEPNLPSAPLCDCSSHCPAVFCPCLSLLIECTRSQRGKVNGTQRVWRSQSSQLGSRAVLSPELWGSLWSLRADFIHPSENIFHFLTCKIDTLKQKAYITFS